MDKEEAVWIVSPFGFGEPRVVVSPIRVLKIGFEEVAF
jgi:hypothetical protein